MPSLGGHFVGDLDGCVNGDFDANGFLILSKLSVKARFPRLAGELSSRIGAKGHFHGPYPEGIYTPDG